MGGPLNLLFEPMAMECPDGVDAARTKSATAIIRRPLYVIS